MQNGQGGLHGTATHGFLRNSKNDTAPYETWRLDVANAVVETWDGRWLETEDIIVHKFLNIIFDSKGTTHASVHAGNYRGSIIHPVGGHMP